MKILVTYASRVGSIAIVADKIGETLNRIGETAVVKPMNEVTDVKPYDAVVAGSMIHSERWLPEAISFLHRHQSVLTEMPFAIFTVSMAPEMKEKRWYRAAVMEWIAPVRSLVRPFCEELFSGDLDNTDKPAPEDRLKFKLSSLFGVLQDNPHKKWYDIERWAVTLPVHFNSSNQESRTSPHGQD